jgi:integrase
LLSQAFPFNSKTLDFPTFSSIFVPIHSRRYPPNPTLQRVSKWVLKSEKAGIWRYVMLSEVQIRKAKPQEKAYRLTDQGGLHLFVTPAGGKLWRLRYKIDGKEKTLSLGQYPLVSLADARLARDEAKKTKATGRDPGVQKKLDQFTKKTSDAVTFEVLAREWFELNKAQWVERHAEDVINSLERDIFPMMGSLPVADITPATVLGVLRQIEGRGAKETARRIRQRISAAFVYGISSGKCQNDPAAIVSGAMAPLPKKGRQPAIVDLDSAIEMLRQTEETPASPVTKLAIRLLALTAVRPGVITNTPWAELTDLDENNPVWLVPSERMKLALQMKGDEARDHLVPLSRQAIETIEALRTITGKGPLVFPNGRHAHKPMSENAMGYLLNRAGYHHKHVPHGFRSTFSTIMNERYPTDRAIIDFMLGHVPKDQVERAYNRALYLDRRVELAQLWADLVMRGAPAAAALLEGPRKVFKLKVNR